MTTADSGVPSLLTIDTEEYLHPPFSLLARLIGQTGRFALPEDLAGMSGFLFRTAWSLGGEKGGARRWSQRSASFYAGDALRLAAEACGLSLVRKRGGREEHERSLPPGARRQRSALFRRKGERWGICSSAAPLPSPDAEGEWIFLEGEGAPFTVTSRIEHLEESLRLGAVAGRGEPRAHEGPFATGIAAYDTLLADLSLPLSEMLPSSEEESIRLAPSLARMPALDPSLFPPLSLLVALRATLASLARGRAHLLSYLDRAGNFIDSLPPLPAYREEANALRRATLFLPDPWPRSGRVEDAAAEWSRRIAADKKERAPLASLLRKARKASLRAVGLLEACVPSNST